MLVFLSESPEVFLLQLCSFLPNPAAYCHKKVFVVSPLYNTGANTKSALQTAVRRHKIAKQALYQGDV